MKFAKTSIAAVVLASVALTGCANNADQYAADAYQVDQLNSKQETKTVNIISVVPAKVFVDNKDNQDTAKAVGTVLGAVVGAVLGYQTGSDWGTAAAGVAGATVGGVAGGMTKGKVQVDGVSLTYKEDTKVYTSTQVGKQCMFSTGMAVVITTKANETRIQPNATCPAAK